MLADSRCFLCDAERGFLEDYVLKNGVSCSYAYDFKPILEVFFSNPIQHSFSIEDLVRKWSQHVTSKNIEPYYDDMNPITEGFRSDFLSNFYSMETSVRELTFDKNIAPYSTDQLYWAALQAYCSQIAPKVWKDRESFFKGWLHWISNDIKIYKKAGSNHTYECYQVLFNQVCPDADLNLFKIVMSLYVKFNWETVGYFLPSPVYKNFKHWLNNNIKNSLNSI